ncbi:ABC transporter ATP-binding protein [Paenibacillus konkukensis]|uniref:ABC transporter ATP-binding protein n=1 Tax=Paenibacillus konkukensis TaxID=2020716 RepID=UPI00201E64FF|nr:ABC transporter ATP-binding protein [Paenibacillus konkukensis]
MSDTQPLLSLHDVRASFRTPNGIVHAVRGVSMELKQGQIYGLIGETGSGKSVLGLTIPGLLPAEAEVSGSIVYKGQSLLELDPRSRRKLRGRDIALIPQNPASSLNPVLSIGYQLLEAIRLYGRIGRKEAREQAIGLLEELGLPEPRRQLRAYPFQLSGGMKQRVLAAIGTAGAPSLLIADEPTKGLDAVVRNQVASLLRAAARRTGAAMLVITHDLHVARALCDRIGVMYAGQIVEEAAAAELFVSPRHPYTRGLLGSLPGRGMAAIPGASPSLTEMLPGCAFHPRCGERLALCAAAQPQLQAIAMRQDGGRKGEADSAGCKARCFLYDSGRASEQTVSERTMEPASVPGR